MTRGSVRKMLVSYDLESGATYVHVRDTEDKAARTVSVSDLVMVDLDRDEEVLGVDFAVPPGLISDAMLGRLADAFPQLKQLAHDRSWLLTHA